jgi:glucokinase
VEQVVALDVGGTSMKGALVDAAGGIVREQRFDTDRHEGPDKVVGRILEAMESLLAAAPTRPAAIGIAIPGTVDEDAGVAVDSANLGWRDVPIAELVTMRTDLPVRIGHDVRCGAISEDRAGAGRGCTSLLFVPVGTGIGGAFVSAGEALRGAHHRAAELGHLQVSAATRRCGCGREGCLETVASASAIARDYGERVQRGDVTAEAVAARVREGEPAATEVWMTAVEALGEGIAAAVTLFDPERVVIGGGLSAAGTTLLDPLRRTLTGRLPAGLLPDLRAAELGDRAGCIGAAFLAWDLVKGDRT